MLFERERESEGKDDEHGDDDPTYKTMREVVGCGDEQLSVMATEELFVLLVVYRSVKKNNKRKTKQFWTCSWAVYGVLCPLATQEWCKALL